MACKPGGVSDSFEAELAELVALTREHLRWEMDLGSQGLPEHDVGEHPAPVSVSGAPAEATRAEPRGAEPRRPEPRRAEPPRPEPSTPAPARPAHGLASADRRELLRVIEAEVRTCQKCGLHAGRTQTVFARGNPDAKLVFVGEGPGYNEDKQGQPFVGQAGQLLDKMIAAMGFAEDEVYICNVVKCRPPENRTPNPDEAAACLPFLRAQLEVVRPEVIVALGRCAAETLRVAGPKWRGTWGTWEGVRVMPTYHPAYLLRSPEQKRPVWEDLQQVVSAMGRTLPAKR